MRESKIESYLVKRVEKDLGGIAYKFTSPNRRNVPDRVMLLPGKKADGRLPQAYWDVMAPSRIVFVELKAPGKKPTAGQSREHERIRALGFTVEVLDSIEAVDDFLTRWV